MLFVRPTNEARQLGTSLLKHWHTDFWQPLPLRHHARDHPERSDRVHHQLTASHSGHRTRWSPRARILRALKRRATRCCQRARRGSKFGADYNITVVPLEEIPYLARRIHTLGWRLRLVVWYSWTCLVPLGSTDEVRPKLAIYDPLIVTKGPLQYICFAQHYTPPPIHLQSPFLAAAPVAEEKSESSLRPNSTDRLSLSNCPVVH